MNGDSVNLQAIITCSVIDLLERLRIQLKPGGGWEITEL